MKTKNQLQLLASKKEAAEALAISSRMVDYLISRRQLAVVRIGRRTLIPWKVLEEFAGGNHG